MADYQQMNLDEARNYILNAPATYWRSGIFLHNTANTGYSGAVGMNALIDHLNNLGWTNAFYHFVVDPDGTIWRFAPIEGIANHIGSGYNTEYISISLQGNYNEQYVTPTQAASVALLCKAIAERYDVPAMPRFHREVDATACPGWNVTPELVAQWLAGDPGYQPPVIQPPATTPSPDMSFITKPIAPTLFTFIQGSGECLGEGDESPQVRDLEMCLYYLGYISYAPNTYVYDSYTKAGVSTFQINFCPPADGIYGQFTAAALQKEVDRKWSGMPTDTIPQPPVTPPVVPEPPIIIPPLPGETPTPIDDETKTMLQKILALLEQLVTWFKQIFRVN